jgi:hypothetical protein
MTHSTITREDTPMSSATTQTWQQVSLEANPQAGHRLSADVVGTDDQGRDVISVINIDSREHWQLIVQELPPAKR